MLETIDTILKTKNFPPVLLMFGEEDFLLEEAYQKLVQAIEEEGVSGFNQDLVDAEETPAEAVVEMARAYPMMSERRLVVVKNFEKYFSGRASKSAAEKSPFQKIFASPPPSTVLVLRGNIPELNGITALLKNPKQRDKAEKKLKSLKFPYNLILETCEWIEFPKVAERELPSWLAARLKSFGKEISPEGAELLVAQAGNSLRDLSNEVDKLRTYVQHRKKITLDDVNAIVGASRAHNVFELQKAVGNRDLSTALNILHNMLTAERQELLIIAMLTRYFVILWRLGEELHITKNHFQLANAIGVSPFFVPEYIAAMEKFSPEELDNAFFALRDTDAALKSSSQDGEVALQKMLVRIIARK